VRLKSRSCTWFRSNKTDTLMMATRLVTLATAYVSGATSFKSVKAWSRFY
jgi:hypothetical protein